MCVCEERQRESECVKERRESVFVCEESKRESKCVCVER